MAVYALRFIFLTAVCAAGGAFAQTSPVKLPVNYAVPWVQIDLGDDISISNSGLQLLAQNVGDTAPSTGAVGRHRDGLGASGAQASAPAIKAETGFDPVQNQTEHLIISFGQDVREARLDLGYFYRDEAVAAGTSYHERGGWRAYRSNELVATGLFLPDSPDGSFRLKITTLAPFDRLEIFATPYVATSGEEIEPGLIITDSSDFLISHISYRPAQQTQATVVQ